MKHIWNTARLYQQHGQVIAAEIVGNDIYFNDISRGIGGIFSTEYPHLVNTTAALERLVMGQYDHNNFRGCRNVPEMEKLRALAQDAQDWLEKQG